MLLYQVKLCIEMYDNYEVMGRLWIYVSFGRLILFFRRTILLVSTEIGSVECLRFEQSAFRLVQQRVGILVVANSSVN